jgi:hypothetical protein
MLLRASIANCLVLIDFGIFPQFKHAAARLNLRVTLDYLHLSEGSL